MFSAAIFGGMANINKPTVQGWLSVVYPFSGYHAPIKNKHHMLYVWK